MPKIDLASDKLPMPRHALARAGGCHRHPGRRDPGSRGGRTLRECARICWRRPRCCAGWPGPPPRCRAQTCCRQSLAEHVLHSLPSPATSWPWCPAPAWWRCGSTGWPGVTVETRHTQTMGECPAPNDEAAPIEKNLAKVAQCFPLCASSRTFGRWGKPPESGRRSGHLPH